MTATVEATELLGAQVRQGRLARGETLAQLAERVGVSVKTLRKVERGDPTVSIGTALDAATIVGVPLLAENADERRGALRHTRTMLALLPQRARERRVRDDF